MIEKKEGRTLKVRNSQRTCQGKGKNIWTILGKGDIRFRCYWGKEDRDR